MVKGSGDRRRRVRQQLLNHGEIEFSVLAQAYGVSEMTIRRDIDELEAEGLVRKVVGGAIALGKIAEPAFESRAHQDVESKRHIAELAVGELSARETLILDSGSTALAVARAVRGRGLSLTVVTPSVLAAADLAQDPDTTVLLTGGFLRPGELSLIGVETVESLGRFNCDTYVMGVSGVHPHRGYTDYHRDEGAVKRAAVDAADRLIVIADHSKMGRAHLTNIAPLGAADILITDELPDAPVPRAAAAAGVRVVHAPPQADRGSEVAL
jgi:DeoR/GlpR family transcriptional regulator of sugar metabolism